MSYTSQTTAAHEALSLLVSQDGTHDAQLTTYDVASEPRTMVVSERRPARGGSLDAPVIVVGFDGLKLLENLDYYNWPTKERAKILRDTSWLVDQSPPTNSVGRCEL